LKMFDPCDGRFANVGVSGGCGRWFGRDKRTVLVLGEEEAAKAGGTECTSRTSWGSAEGSAETEGSA
jgi:hypothetical protein